MLSLRNSKVECGPHVLFQTGAVLGKLLGQTRNAYFHAPEWTRKFARLSWYRRKYLTSTGDSAEVCDKTLPAPAQMATIHKGKTSHRMPTSATPAGGSLDLSPTMWAPGISRRLGPFAPPLRQTVRNNRPISKTGCGPRERRLLETRVGSSRSCRQNSCARPAQITFLRVRAGEAILQI